MRRGKFGRENAEFNALLQKLGDQKMSQRSEQVEMFGKDER